MREIKFRAWDADSEYMFYSDKPEDEYFFEFNIDGKFKAFVIRYDGFVGTFYEPPQPEAEELHDVMQYTGLKDKNGKEIYEGDIVAINGGADPIKTAVFFEDGCYCVKMLDKACELKYYIDMPFCKLEIIGNIYEHKG